VERGFALDSGWMSQCEASQNLLLLIKSLKSQRNFRSFLAFVHRDESFQHKGAKGRAK
jgi:hypothetical protein